ncbi:hypothetical protein F8S13_08680 [Chloroflexia bacterium SDU3-3]|nr:hypothetical protein F8S13_08680 [Chloroflexia bacterium SDU3-3]
MQSVSRILDVLGRYPTLRQYMPSVAAQQRRVDERLRHIVQRTELFAEFDTLVGEIGSGLLLVEGPAGAGATTLLCQLAQQRGYPLWLPDDDLGEGLAALCAQIIAAHDLPIAVVPPAAGRDSSATELLIAEAAARRPANDPLIILVDAPPPLYAAHPPPLPIHMPPGAVLVYTTSDPSAPPPVEPAARLRLPTAGPVLIRSLVEAAMAHGLAKQTAAHVAAHSGRSFLYVALACSLIEQGIIQRRALPEGLAALHSIWWGQIGQRGQDVARLLAVAAEPLPLPLLAEASGTTAPALAKMLRGWGALAELHDGHAALYHHVTRAFVAQQGDLQPAHAALIALGRARFGQDLDLLPQAERYLTHHLSRHIALSQPYDGEASAPLIQRSWVLAQERRAGDLRQAAQDAAWVARATAGQDLDMMIRAAITGGTLTTLSRRMLPDVGGDAFVAALDRGEPREVALRRMRALLDQLPDGREKALVLRRLGEICFERGFRTQAMRLLAEALDLEVPGLPRTWRDEREEAQVTLARAALTANAYDRALGITVRIAHPERRGMIETEVVRHLIASGNLTRAEEVAHAIGHEHTHEWAMAEVAAGHARAGQTRRFREVLGTLKTDTASAWARSELACDAARRGDTAAVEQVALITNERLRHQALGLVAQALVVGGQPPSALMAARMITQREVRVRTLIDLALLKAPNAPVALGLAYDDVRLIGDDEHMPLTVLLATAYATIGDLAAAMHTVEMLDEGEERDRGYSRVAAALARAGELDTGVRIALSIPDADERDWTLHELVVAYGNAGKVERAAELLEKIADDAQRARAMADLCIARARGGRIAGAITAIGQIGPSAERARALSGMAESMVTRGFEARAETAREMIADIAARSRYTLALTVALAGAGQIDAAERMARLADRPLDRARALVACARASAQPDAARAARLLGAALLHAAALGRSEIVAVVTAAADLLVMLGGTELLLSAAHALDEVDSWWG